MIFFLGFYAFFFFYEMPQFNWQDYHEPKHELQQYADLIEGGDEGDED